MTNQLRPIYPQSAALVDALAAHEGALPSLEQLISDSEDIRRVTRVRRGLNLCSFTNKTVLDWVTAIRLAAGMHLGVTIEERGMELGVSLRTIRRLCVRIPALRETRLADACPRLLLSEFSRLFERC
jgi:hypothetical protein